MKLNIFGNPTTFFLPESLTSEMYLTLQDETINLDPIDTLKNQND